MVQSTDPVSHIKKVNYLSGLGMCAYYAANHHCRGFSSCIFILSCIHAMS